MISVRVSSFSSVNYLWYSSNDGQARSVVSVGERRDSVCSRRPRHVTQPNEPSAADVSMLLTIAVSDTAVAQRERRRRPRRHAQLAFGFALPRPSARS
jgi:hypothetical protein